MGAKTALITGIGGQDGSYLAELLLEKGYTIRGIVRRASYPHTERVDHLLAAHDDRDPQCRFKLYYADLTDASSIRNVIEEVQPDELYNLAGQSHVGISFQTGESTLDISRGGTKRADLFLALPVGQHDDETGHHDLLMDIQSTTTLINNMHAIPPRNPSGKSRKGLPTGCHQYKRFSYVLGRRPATDGGGYRHPRVIFVRRLATLDRCRPSTVGRFLRRV